MDARETLSQLDNLMPIFRERLAAGQNVSIMPQGTSMLPMLRQGMDSVTLSPLPSKLKKYDLPLYQRKDGHYVLHRIIKVGDTYTCIGDNQFVCERGLTHDQMIAIVTSFTRGNYKISVDSLQYRAYCLVWHYSRPVRRFWRQGISWIRRSLG